MIRRFAATALLLLLMLPRGSARADCLLTSNGQMRPPGAIVYNSGVNVLQYCAGTVWKAMVWNAVGGSGGGGSSGCFTTWTQGLAAPAGMAFYTIVASSDDGTKLAAAVADDYIYTSADGGTTWTKRTGSGVRTWGDIASSADGIKLAATELWGGRIYTSADSGATWTPRATNRNWGSIASSADGTKLAANVWGGKIYTSADSGATWAARATNQNWSDPAPQRVPALM